MKLSVLDCEPKGDGLYLVALKFGNDEFLEKISVVEGVVPHIEYSEFLSEILHRNVGIAKNLNEMIFKFYRTEVVEFPVDVGEF